MAILDQVKTDMTAAMKAGERERTQALRLVLSSLQGAAKEGSDDEVAVLRRERKRRHDASQAFRDGGRPELADKEDFEARTIEAYLPAEMSDSELALIVAEAVRETGAAAPKDMGKVMGRVMGQVGARADGRRVSGKVREALED
ncbi:MAG: GatB/YqeY domain-containing protein [Solirubrobacteraceae bacterium]